jgi:hypothetical protein
MWRQCKRSGFAGQRVSRTLVARVEGAPCATSYRVQLYTPTSRLSRAKRRIPGHARTESSSLVHTPGRDRRPGSDGEPAAFATRPAERQAGELGRRARRGGGEGRRGWRRRCEGDQGDERPHQGDERRHPEGGGEGAEVKPPRGHQPGAERATPAHRVGTGSAWRRRSRRRQARRGGDGRRRRNPAAAAAALTHSASTTAQQLATIPQPGLASAPPFRLGSDRARGLGAVPDRR